MIKKRASAHESLCSCLWSDKPIRWMRGAHAPNACEQCRADCVAAIMRHGPERLWAGLHRARPDLGRCTVCRVLKLEGSLDPEAEAARLSRGAAADCQ
eukprot:680545-Rhodomonas_salina.5